MNIPEPSVIALGGIGAALLLVWRYFSRWKKDWLVGGERKDMNEDFPE